MSRVYCVRVSVCERASVCVCMRVGLECERESVWAGVWTRGCVCEGDSSAGKRLEGLRSSAVNGRLDARERLCEHV